MANPIQVLNDVRHLRARHGLPKTLFWAIINHCNAVCLTCRFYLVPKTTWNYVHLEDARRAVDILYESDFRMTSITGGEPLMNPDVFDICDYLHKKNFMITYMPTNGTLVTKRVAGRLKDADVKLVGVSIDMDDGNGMGLTRKIPHLRETVIRARECLEGEGLKTYAGILLTKKTADVGRVLDLVKDLGFDKVVFSYPQLVQSSSYMASRESEDLMLDVDELERVVKAIRSAKRNGDGISIHNPSRSLDEFAKHYEGRPRTYKCYGGSKLFYLDWNLDLYRCFTLPTRYGNLLELGKVDIEEDPCDLCTQQAFRDHDPFYYLGETLIESKNLLAGGHVVSAVRKLATPETRAAYHALYELMTGGFA